MDKNFISKDEMEKKETKRKCFVTIANSKETKLNLNEIKSTFFLILVIHNKEIINNHEHSSRKIDFPNNQDLKPNKDLNSPSAIIIDQKLNRKGKSKRKEIFFEISKNQNVYKNNIISTSQMQDKQDQSKEGIVKKKFKSKNLISPGCSEDHFIFNPSNQSETNFYVDIPIHSLKNPPNISSIKVLSPGGSTCEDNSNLKSLSYFENPNLSSEATKNSSHLKFKIEIQGRDQRKTLDKKNKNNSKKPSNKSSDLLMKSYNEIKDSKLLGKKRLNEEKVNLEEKHNEIDISVNMYKVNFDYEPKKLTDFSDCLSKSKKFSKKNIKFYKERIAFYNNDKAKINSNDNNFNSIQNSSYQIVNPFDQSLRNEYALSLSFQKKFQEEYVPIQLQKENESATVSKTHFIKKKQSPLNIKRHCGVSYVLPSESKQLNVTDKYRY